MNCNILFCAWQKLSELEKHFISLSSENDIVVKSVNKEFSLAVQPNEESILNK